MIAGIVRDSIVVEAYSPRGRAQGIPSATVAPPREAGDRDQCNATGDVDQISAKFFTDGGLSHVKNWQRGRRE